MKGVARFKDQCVFSWDDYPLRPPVSTDGRNRGILKPAGCRQFCTGRLRSENAAYTYFEQRYNGVLEAAGRFKDQRVFSWDDHPLRPPCPLVDAKMVGNLLCQKPASSIQEGILRTARWVVGAGNCWLTQQSGAKPRFTYEPSYI